MTTINKTTNQTQTILSYQANPHPPLPRSLSILPPHYGRPKGGPMLRAVLLVVSGKSDELPQQKRLHTNGDFWL